MKNNLRIFLLAITTVLTQFAFAQTKTISGIVTDSDN